MTRKQVISKLCNFLIFLLLITLISCKKTDQSQVPAVPVNILIDQPTILAAAQGDIISVVPDSSKTGGVVTFNFGKTSYHLGDQVYGNGFEVYVAGYMTSYIAYDLTCTYNGLTSDCALIVNYKTQNDSCPCCGSKFNVPLGGTVISGKAVVPLKTYNATLGNGGLLISN